jgi:MFS family permease
LGKRRRRSRTVHDHIHIPSRNHSPHRIRTSGSASPGRDRLYHRDAIEWYDFFLYSTVTGLVFAKLFFPHSDRWVGTLEAFAIYAVGFLARPVGAAIFGHFGDRIGRKSTLIATLLLMGLATARWRWCRPMRASASGAR